MFSQAVEALPIDDLRLDLSPAQAGGVTDRILGVGAVTARPMMPVRITLCRRAIGFTPAAATAWMC
ncbi:hypothetical protein EBN03_11950 [Nocardia stercoris]|uniref:Uncharacterized protein n=1 Tax=Nocardia stercoris TaxID=2483361 RepID=A0A3M2L845_9NOCA|nr:hypothetical protein EBN03_11950 [Nocardia stercoris]